MLERKGFCKKGELYDFLQKESLSDGKNRRIRRKNYQTGNV